MLTLSLLFFFNDTPTTDIYTLSLHDALPIYREPGEAVGEEGHNGAVHHRHLSERPRRLHTADEDRGAGHQHQCRPDRKSTRLNSSHTVISYAVFCLKKKKKKKTNKQSTPDTR